MLTEIAYKQAHWLWRAFKSRCERKLNRHVRARAHNVQLSLAVYIYIFY